MWLSQSKYDQLIKERDELKADLGIAQMNTQVLEKQRNCYINLYQEVVKQLDDHRETIDKTLNLMDSIVNLTFDGSRNNSLKTVVLQAYGQAPKIFYEGRVIQGDDITINFKDNNSSIVIKETI